MKKFLMFFYCFTLIAVIPFFLVACQNNQASKNASAPIEVVSEETSFSKWDVNRDGSVNISDVSEILNIISYYEAGTATEDQIARADVNENGKVSQVDANTLLEYLARA